MESPTLLIRTLREAITKRTLWKSLTLHGERTLASICSDAVRQNSPRLAQRWWRFGDEGEAMFVVWLGGEEMLAVAGEGGEAV